MRRILVFIISALLASCYAANAQSILDRLKDRAKDAVEENIGNKVEKGVNDILDGNFGKKKDKKEKPEKKKADIPAEQQAQEAGEAVAASTWTCEECGKAGNTGKFCEECGARKPAAQAAKPAQGAVNAAWTCPECGKDGNTGKFCEDCGAKKPGAETAAKPAPVKPVATEYAKSDFVPGDEIFFDDDFAGERLGEFASRWELLDGYAEVASVEGRKVLAFTDDGVGTVIPLMKDKLAFLPDVFTVEYDLYVAPVSDDASDSKIEISLCFGRKGQDYDSGGEIGNVRFFYTEEGDGSLNWLIHKPNSDSSTDGTKDLGLSQSFSSYNGKDNPLKAGQWNHFAFSFNKRAFKGYINGQRIISIPSAAAPAYVMVRSAAKYRYSGISNFRMAKGAVPLYDRLASDGKIVTYAITFETGKADLKPESMVEILRIAKLMQENPGIEFEVQGHCDSTGSDKVNDPLSQKRAEAIVTALVEQGIAESRLTAVGKGSHAPIASNSTDEGRARNRRVEFVKK